MRPKRRPKGTEAATTSMRLKSGTRWRRAKTRIAITTPISPPWNDMPPSQTRTIAKGSAA